jgi:hypothetical protein
MFSGPDQPTRMTLAEGLAHLRREVHRLSQGRWVQLTSDHPFREELWSRYRERVLKALSACLSPEKDTPSPEAISSSLQAFLKENWELTRGTCLSYTALPEDPITHLCQDVATYLSAALAEQASKEGEGEGEGEGEDKKEGVHSPIALLMPGVNLISEAGRPLYAFSLEEICRAYMLDDKKETLLPVELFLQDPLEPKSGTSDCLALHRRYWRDGMDIDLTQAEVLRLAAHSPLTQAVYDAWLHYTQLAHQKDTLLGQLNLLIKQLTYYSVSGIGGGR